MTLYYRRRRDRVVYRYLAPSADRDYLLVDDGVIRLAVHRDEGDLIDSAAATVFYELRPDRAALNPEFQPGIRYPALTDEDEGGYVVLEVEREGIEVDVDHFERTSSE